MISPCQFNVVGDGETDNTARIQAMWDDIGNRGGGLVYWPGGHYRTDRTFLRDNTTVMFEPGAVLESIGNNIFRLQNVTNVALIGPARFLKSGGVSANLYVTGSKRIEIDGLHLDGAAERKDCLYIGGMLNEDVIVRGVRMSNPGRNGISVVTGKRVTVEHCEASGALGLMGSGFHVESNIYDMVDGVTFRHCHSHGNLKGFHCGFGNDVLFERNHAEGNTDSGFSCGAGGTQFNDGVYRPGIDVRAVSAFDTATGEVTAPGAFPLRVGTLVFFGTRNGAALPAEFQSPTRWMVASVDGDKVRLSRNGGYTTQGALSDGGSGTLTADPATSDIILRCYEEGQCSNVAFEGNRSWLNGGEELELFTGVNLTARGNDLRSAPDRMAIKATYARGLTIEGNRAQGDVASTSVLARGLHIGTCSEVRTRENRFEGFPGYGAVLNSVQTGRFTDDRFTDCGALSGEAVQLAFMRKPQMRGTVVRGAGLTHGINVKRDVSHGLFEGVDCEGVGTDNAKSINVPGTENRVVNSIQKDGSFR